jgi:DNA (cytosine-5)-methyltransferase 1
MRVIWQSEIDGYACRVLNKHWPDVPNIGDITQVDWSQIERPDVICGGYPCQPFSTAGKRKGENDERHLWPYVREAISHLRPRYAILENVRGHLSLGGLTVVGELAAIGYDAEWRIVSAASVGANHRRDRIFIVAYPNRGRQQEREPERESSPGSCFGGSGSVRQPVDWWQVEPNVGRVADGVPRRVDRLAGLGNAVVPQVAEVIGRLVVAHNARETAL